MRFDAIVFDLGNTLVPWGERETASLIAALASCMDAGPDFARRAHEARTRQIRESESTMREVTVRGWIEELLAGDAPVALVEAVTATLSRRFVELARVPEYVPGLLEKLAADRPLGLLSNFVLTAPIEEFLERAGIRRHFTHVEVSATDGFCKPHPAPFDTVREALGVPMERILMVGDDFWADIVGGSRAGFLTALTHEHRRGPTSDARAPDVQADQIIHDLRDLPPTPPERDAAVRHRCRTAAL
jgi:FMN phosphatase YigB (HAD superfamily)